MGHVSGERNGTKTLRRIALNRAIIVLTRRLIDCLLRKCWTIATCYWSVRLDRVLIGWIPCNFGANFAVRTASLVYITPLSLIVLIETTVLFLQLLLLRVLFNTTFLILHKFFFFYHFRCSIQQLIDIVLTLQINHFAPQLLPAPYNYIDDKTRPSSFFCMMTTNSMSYGLP